jgi:signal transduction histidine kinase
VSRGPRSVRARLTIWYATVLALSVLVFSLAVYAAVRSSLVGQLDQSLADGLSSVEDALGEGLGEIGELEDHGVVPFFRLAEGGRTLYRTTGWRNAGLDSALAISSPDGFRTWTSPEGHRYEVGTGEGELAGEGLGDGLSFQVAVDAELAHQGLNSLALTLLIGFVGVLALAAAGGYFLAGRVLSPVGVMAAKARAVSASNLSDRLPIENPDDEFGRLATVFNQMLARLGRSFDQLQRFTGDASHELRTPLTAIRSVGEVGLQRETDVKGLRDVIGSMLEENDRLRGIVDALLAVTRSEADGPGLDLVSVRLGELAREVAELLHVLAEERGQHVSVEDAGPVDVLVDRLALRQALVNLLDNAIKYTPKGGSITISTGFTDEGEPFVAVRDEGSGLPPDERDKVFRRFYRVEAEGASRPPGVGLGLAIALRATEAHGGRIEVESEMGRGSVFRIVLPIHAAQAE